MMVDVFPLVVKSAMVPGVLILKRHGPLPVLGIVTMILWHLIGSKPWRENTRPGRHNVSSRMRRGRERCRVRHTGRRADRFKRHAIPLRGMHSRVEAHVDGNRAWRPLGHGGSRRWTWTWDARFRREWVCRIVGCHGGGRVEQEAFGHCGGLTGLIERSRRRAGVREGIACRMPLGGEAMIARWAGSQLLGHVCVPLARLWNLCRGVKVVSCPVGASGRR